MRKDKSLDYLFRTDKKDFKRERVMIMRFYESQTLERVGFDFYCDVANNIVKARKEKQLTQEELAKKAKIRLSRLSGIENVKIRLDLDDLEKLSRVLDVSIDWLIEAELDFGGKECLYLIWLESSPNFKIYKRATSKRMAFLLFDKMLKEARVRYSSGRERFFVKLVGVPISTSEIQSKFPKRTSDELPIEPD